jgi:hypothetical protein
LRTDPIAAFELSFKKAASANDLATLSTLSAVKFRKIMVTYSTGEGNDARKKIAHDVKNYSTRNGISSRNKSRSVDALLILENRRVENPKSSSIRGDFNNILLRLHDREPFDRES